MPIPAPPEGFEIQGGGMPPPPPGFDLAPSGPPPPPEGFDLMPAEPETRGQTWRSLPQAKADDDAPPPPSTGSLADIPRAAIAGGAASLRDIANAPGAVAGKVPEQPQGEQPYYAQPLAWGDLLHPSIAAPKITYQLANSLPSMAGGIAGGIAGGAVAPEGGPLGPMIGAAAGAGGVSAVQSLAPYFATEMAKPGAKPDEAFNAALEKAGQSGAISGAGWALFGWQPFASAAKNILFQAAAVQPGIAVGQKGLENVEGGQPVTEGMGDVIPGAVVGTAVPLVGHAVVHEALTPRAAAAPELRQNIEDAHQAAADFRAAQNTPPEPPAPTSVEDALTPPPRSVEDALGAAPPADAAPHADNAVADALTPIGTSPQTHDDVWQRQIHQESGGHQTDAHGNPLTSSAGAVGVAQVMPATARKVASDLGIPFDENRYRTDPAYNEMLGKAYKDQMLARYGGDETLATAAYNAGPGNVDRWLWQIGDPRSGMISAADWVARIPIDETRKYVANILHGVGDIRGEPSRPVGEEERPLAPPPGVDPYAASPREHETDVSRAQDDRVEKDQDAPSSAQEARQSLAESGQRIMRFMGLPSDVGLKLVDRITDGAGGEADGRYTRSLVELALDSQPDRVPVAIWHESMHALTDPRLGLLSPADTRALNVAADRWLEAGGRDELLARGYDPKEMREEAISKLGEQALAQGLTPQGLPGRIADRLRNAVQGVGQMLRGEGYKTADDVFRGMLEGKRAVGPDMAGPVLPAQYFPQGQDQGEGPLFSKRDLPLGDDDRISTRVPWAKSAGDTGHDTNQNFVGIESTKASGPAFEKNAELIRNYTGVKASQAKTPMAVASRFIAHLRDNLLALHDAVPADIRERSKLWYDGANRIAHQWAADFGYPPRAIAAAMAALSPQKDWFQNVDLARRILTTLRDQRDTVMTPEMRLYAEGYIGRLEESGTPADAENARRLRGYLEDFQTRTLRDVKGDMPQAVWVRWFDEAHNDRGYPIVTPEGAFAQPSLNANGKPQRVAWGSFNEISKAVSVLDDHSLANISRQMGSNHKVRNFYNNIIAPHAEHGDVTIDTHAIAADLMRPLSGNSVEVAHGLGLGSGAADHAATGSKGLYGLHAEAYRQAAAARGILPREMQSITWEAIRGLFSPEQRRNKTFIASVDGVWNDYKRGRINADEARQRVIGIAGGIDPPEWVGSGVEGNAGPQHDSQPGNLHLGELGTGRSAAVDGGTGERTAGAVSQEGLGLLSRRSDEAPRVPLYSPTARAVDALKQAKGSGEQMLAMLSRAPGVKPEELKWMDLPNWLKAQKSVTKDQIADYVRAHALDVREVVRGGERQEPEWREGTRQGNVRQYRLSVTDPFKRHAESSAQDALVEQHGNAVDGKFFAKIPGGSWRPFDSFSGAQRWVEEGIRTPADLPARYSDYTLPGGSNYREMLITLPHTPEPAGRIDALSNGKFLVNSPSGSRELFNTRAEAEAETHRLGGIFNEGKGGYRSAHWDEPNVLAHIRFADHTAPDGKRVLLVEENQSDWHQAGRKQGYQGDAPTPPEGVTLVRHPKSNALLAMKDGKVIEEWHPSVTEDRAIRQLRGQDTGLSKGVPDAPFRTSWPSLVMKRMLKYAADNGYDRIAWAPGDVHADRYDLSKQLDRVEYEPMEGGQYEIAAYDKSGKEVLHEDEVGLGRIEDLVGKDVAQKIADDAGEPMKDRPLRDWRSLSGLDLKVGGEGMRGFYDNMLPKETQKIVGKYGAKVGQSEIGTGEWRVFGDPDKPDSFMVQSVEDPSQRMFFNNRAEADRAAQSQNQAVHSVDIHPAMRDQIASEGMPLFAKRDPDQIERAGRQTSLALQGKGPPGQIARIADSILKTFSPTSRPGAQPMEFTVRRHAAEQAQSLAQTQHRLEDLRNAMGKLSEAEQDDFTHRMETGQRQATPEMQQVANALRQAFDQWTKKIQSLGKGHLANARENYMPHVYSNYKEWSEGQQSTPETQAEAQQRAAAAGQSKAPIRGSGAFLKPRSFDTLQDAMRAGLEPISHNPLDVALIKLREVQKFYHGNRMADAIKEAGMAHWVPAGDEGGARAAGWVKLDDSVFQPRLMGDSNPAGFGRLEAGNWYAPEQVATIFNNYVARGLSGNPVFDLVRQSGNALNQMQLGLSAFHATFVSIDTMISKMALGLQEIMRGQIGAGAKDVVMGMPFALPVTVYSNVARGARLQRAMLDPENAPADIRPVLDAALTAGARMNMQQFYRSDASGSFIRSMRDLKNPAGPFREAWAMVKDNPLAAPFRVAARMLETINEPLMGQFVPKAKLGIFSDMAQSWLKANPAATPEARQKAFTQMWDSVDNRMGQMVYDNLFWHKTLKDMAFVTTRSVGWNLGTVRELGGAAVDTAQAARNIAQFRAPEFTARMAYALAMPAFVAMVGAVLTYARTGRGPDQMMDYFFPPGPSGDDKDRIIIPSYIKDVIEYAHAPVQTVLNKLHPLASMATQLYNNRDFYGGIIYNSQMDNPVHAYSEYVLNQTLPFSIRSMMRQQDLGGTPTDQALGFFGFQAAPQSIVNPARGEMFQHRQDQMAFKRRMKEKGRITLPAFASP